MYRQLRRHTINTGIQAGRLLNHFGLNGPKFSSARLLNIAQELAVFDRWGEPDPHEPLEVLCQDLEADANLHLPGRIATRFDLLRLLKHRLGIEKSIANNPAIAQQTIQKPIIVVGLPRTGTTMLHSLLARDIQHRAPLTWETMNPLQATQENRSQHEASKRKVSAQLAWLDGLAPNFHRIHAVAAELPQECVVITAHSLHSYQFQTTHLVPGYQHWLHQQDRVIAYRYHRRFLQHLQWQTPDRRWVLKAPAHLFGLSELLQVYPDACIIQTHREPTQVMSSLASLTINLRRAFSHHQSAHQIGPEVTQRWSQALELALQARDQQQVPASRIFDVDYHQFIADPLAMLRKIYSHFELDLPLATEARMRNWLDKNPKHRHGKHQHVLSDYGLHAERINQHFDAYRQRFLDSSSASARTSEAA